ncbi:FKBP-type peptidyl-prolyl cis-trans isomerase [Methanofollis fontis]|uniref:Peptidyl-prolyl cis-trans isomerase n=1 Tax=Methanofollis fontis TaxID=2052832 RepID=A0A483CLU5_9EURY|nr:peptidylprolyl isomerase [Methanofollis fontis]TAJ43857.1 peptidylprolyl isomerase [Methanofollis fontis]
MKSGRALAGVLVLAALICAAGCTGTAENSVAEVGDNVTVDYTGSFPNGTVFDTSIGRKPFTFTIGKNMVIEGFEKAVIGLSEGESVSVLIPAAEAYGEYNPDLVSSVNRSGLPDDTAVGQMFLQQINGQTVIFRVIAINETTVVMDANPALAGEDLKFDITLLSIQKAAS